MFETDVRLKRDAPATTKKPEPGILGVDPPPVAPLEAPPGPTAVDLTNEHARRLLEARYRADADPWAKRLLELRAAGVPLARALQRIEEERGTDALQNAD